MRDSGSCDLSSNLGEATTLPLYSDSFSCRPIPILSDFPSPSTDTRTDGIKAIKYLHRITSIMTITVTITDMNEICKMEFDEAERSICEAEEWPRSSNAGCWTRRTADVAGADPSRETSRPPTGSAGPVS